MLLVSLMLQCSMEALDTESAQKYAREREFDQKINQIYKEEKFKKLEYLGRLTNKIHPKESRYDFKTHFRGRNHLRRLQSCAVKNCKICAQNQVNGAQNGASCDQCEQGYQLRTIQTPENGSEGQNQSEQQICSKPVFLVVNELSRITNRNLHPDYVYLTLEISTNDRNPKKLQIKETPLLNNSSPFPGTQSSSNSTDKLQISIEILNTTQNSPNSTIEDKEPKIQNLAFFPATKPENTSTIFITFQITPQGTQNYSLSLTLPKNLKYLKTTQNDYFELQSLSATFTAQPNAPSAPQPAGIQTRIAPIFGRTNLILSEILESVAYLAFISEYETAAYLQKTASNLKTLYRLRFINQKFPKYLGQFFDKFDSEIRNSLIDTYPDSTKAETGYNGKLTDYKVPVYLNRFVFGKGGIAYVIRIVLYIPISFLIKLFFRFFNKPLKLFLFFLRYELKSNMSLFFIYYMDYCFYCVRSYSQSRVGATGYANYCKFASILIILRFGWHLGAALLLSDNLKEDECRDVSGNLLAENLIAAPDRIFLKNRSGRVSRVNSNIKLPETLRKVRYGVEVRLYARAELKNRQEILDLFFCRKDAVFWILVKGVVSNVALVTLQELPSLQIGLMLVCEVFYVFCFFFTYRKKKHFLYYGLYLWRCVTSFLLLLILVIMLYYSIASSYLFFVPFGEFLEKTIFWLIFVSVFAQYGFLVMHLVYIARKIMKFFLVKAKLAKLGIKPRGYLNGLIEYKETSLARPVKEGVSLAAGGRRVADRFDFSVGKRSLFGRSSKKGSKALKAKNAKNDAKETGVGGRRVQRRDFGAGFLGFGGLELRSEEENEDEKEMDFDPRNEKTEVLEGFGGLDKRNKRSETFGARLKIKKNQVAPSGRVKQKVEIPDKFKRRRPRTVEEVPSKGRRGLKTSDFSPVSANTGLKRFLKNEEVVSPFSLPGRRQELEGLNERRARGNEAAGVARNRFAPKKESFLVNDNRGDFGSKIDDPEREMFTRGAKRARRGVFGDGPSSVRDLNQDSGSSGSRGRKEERAEESVRRPAVILVEESFDQEGSQSSQNSQKMTRLQKIDLAVLGELGGERGDIMSLQPSPDDPQSVKLSKALVLAVDAILEDNDLKGGLNLEEEV